MPARAASSMPEPDEAAVERLVARAAAGDQRDLAALRSAGAQDEVLGGVDLDDVGVGLGQAGQALGDDVVDVVVELLDAGRGVGRHGSSFSGWRSVRGGSGLDGFAVAGLGDGGDRGRRGLVTADELVSEGPDQAAEDRSDDVDGQLLPLGRGFAPMSASTRSGPNSRAGLSAAPVIGPTRMITP